MKRRKSKRKVDMSIIKVKVIPNAKRKRIVQEEKGIKVYIDEPPVKGKANAALIKLLSQFFNVKRSDIKIVSGEKSREKIIQISNMQEQ